MIFKLRSVIFVLEKTFGNWHSMPSLLSRFISKNTTKNGENDWVPACLYPLNHCLAIIGHYFLPHKNVNRCIVLLVLFMRWPHHPSSFCTNDFLLNPVTSNQKLSSASKFATLYWSYDFFKLVLVFPKLDLFWRSWCCLPYKTECDLYIWFANQVTRAYETMHQKV